MILAAAVSAAILVPQFAWQVNENRTMIWEGRPYLPVGVRIDGNPEKVRRVAQAGIRDVIVDLPANGSGWDDTIAALEGAGMRYLIAIDSMAPMARGWAIEPNHYRIHRLNGRRDFQFRVPGADSALIVVNNDRDRLALRHLHVRAENDLITARIEGAILDVGLAIFPRLESLSLPSFWSAFDLHRDELLQTLERHRPGPGCRGIVNPLGHMRSMSSASRAFVPDDPLFRLELAAALRERYASLDTAMRAWSMGTAEVHSFEDLARLVPLWSRGRGIGGFWDPQRNQISLAEPRRSAYWNDVDRLIADAETRRFGRLVEAIQARTGLPVVQDWVGWATVYESRRSFLAGLGVRAGGETPSALGDGAAPAVGTGYRWPQPAWIVGTHLSPPTGADFSIEEAIGELRSMGVRGWFFATEDPRHWAALAAEADRLATDIGDSQWTARALFYPEIATNPAMPMRLSAGYWWFPSPSDGSRLDLGSQVSGYRYQSPGQSMVVLWSSSPQRLRFRVADNRNWEVRTIDGSDANLRTVRGGFEMNLGPSPTLFLGAMEVPIPEVSLQEIGQRFDALVAAAEQRRVDLTEERFLFQDSIRNMDRGPFAAYDTMRQQVERATRRLGLAAWIEAESIREHSFSETNAEPAASGGAVLSLRSPWPHPDPFVAETTISSNLVIRDVEVWIAGRFQGDSARHTRVIVNEASLGVPEQAIGQYGRGLGWRKLGALRLKDRGNTLRIEVDGEPGIDIALDVIAIVPPGFRPRGPFLTIGD